jgi:tripartite-type tricarboxylate transporter receptor subunit TctC
MDHELRKVGTRVLGLALAGLAAFGASGQAFGQAFPTRNVTIIVPFAAGGPPDVIMRILGERLSARWGRSVIVENRPGAGTIVATAALARAEADGHTLGVVTNAFAVNPAIKQPLPYDTLKDFAGVSMVVSVPILLVANPTFTANTLAEFVAFAKNRGEPLNFTSAGPRTVGHLAGAWLESLAGIKLTHIAYNGSAPALTDVIAGRVPVMFDLWSSAKPYVADGRLKVLAVASAQRLQDAPQYPTLAETFGGIRRQCLSGPRRSERRSACRDRADFRRYPQRGVVSRICRKGRAARRLPEADIAARAGCDDPQGDRTLDRNRQGREYHCQLDASSPGSAACGRSNPVASATPLTPAETALPAAPRNGRRSQTAL